MEFKSPFALETDILFKSAYIESQIYIFSDQLIDQGVKWMPFIFLSRNDLRQWNNENKKAQSDIKVFLSTPIPTSRNVLKISI